MLRKISLHLVIFHLHFHVEKLTSQIDYLEEFTSNVLLYIQRTLYFLFKELLLQFI